MTRKTYTVTVDYDGDPDDMDAGMNGALGWFADNVDPHGNHGMSITAHDEHGEQIIEPYAYTPVPAEVPKDFPVKVLGPNDPAESRATCGECGRSWDDAISTSYTPVPAGRCPFEYYH